LDTKELAQKIRLHTLRMTCLGKSAHIGSNFSMADLLAVLYGKILNVDPRNPSWSGRDRFILSKGHACAGLYAVLAERGFFSVSKLDTFYQNGSDLCGHVSHLGVSGVEISSGSLGHGLPIGVGMAYAAKLEGKTHKVFVVLSDGECDEGSNWEAILFAPHHKLDNLVVIIDYNKIQSLALVAETLGLEPFVDKWKSFGWGVIEVDGHNHKQIEEGCLKLPYEKNQPTCIIAHTIKGKGVSFMENSVLWHYRTAQGEEFEAAKKELEYL
jgi:transketolase